LARNSDHLADFEEDTGGLFSTLLADEDEFDRRRTLWRVACWGVGSIAAVVVAVMANQSSLGWKREQAMTADLVQQANRLQAVARDSQNEARRLASAVETLNNDRDRLYTRVTMLEQGLDSVTGAIAKQNAAPVVAAQPEPQAPAQPQPAAQPPAPPVAPVAAKPASQPERAASVAPAVTKPAAQPEQAATVAAAATKAAAQSDPKPAALSEKAAATAGVEPAPPTTSAIKEVPTKPATMPATPLVESKSMMAPPDPAAGKLEPAKPPKSVAAEPLPVVAAAPSSEELEATEIALPKVQHTEFGVDVGGANSIGGLRALWRGLLKSRSNAPLLALQPIIVIREGAGRSGMQLRLVAGPLGDAAAAAKLCAVMSENGRNCEPAIYDGQRLSFKPDDADIKPVAPAPPAASRKRGAPQKRAAVEEPAKPTPSSWSSIFGKKN